MLKPRRRRNGGKKKKEKKKSVTNADADLDQFHFQEDAAAASPSPTSRASLPVTLHSAVIVKGPRHFDVDHASAPPTRMTGIRSSTPTSSSGRVEERAVGVASG